MFRISVREEHASGNVHGQPQVGLHWRSHPGCGHWGYPDFITSSFVWHAWSRCVAWSSDKANKDTVR